MVLKELIAFDFDHTIADDNTDIVVLKLLGFETENVMLKKRRETQQEWTDFMNQVFEALHTKGLRKSDLSTVLQDMSLTDGMKEFLEELSTNESRFDCIIISDSNEFFIETILKYYNLEGMFQKVFTNPSTFDDMEKLSIKPCHSHQHENCPANMCKRQLLQEFRDSKKTEGVEYKAVYYVGDGGNDFCPVMALTSADCGFVRRGYALEKRLEKDNNKSKVEGQIVMWSSAAEIGKHLFKN